MGLKLDFRAITKMSRSLSRVGISVGVCPHLLRQIRMKTGEGYARDADLINYCLYHFLIEDDDRDLVIKKIRSMDMGSIKGRKKDEDVNKAYEIQGELLERRFN